ncbi:MAG: MFS transporter [Gammaproteobacteria bacterium]|nr:MFS transporter [Gammaproteobacteria bacterium]MCP5136769.1 MFS transporter [Gammaproteobacteria bacterium]
MSEAVPYWRLSGFYFFYFATLGALVPYWAVYLKDRGFDAVAIGTLMALLMLSKLVAPNLWGWLADRTGQHMRVVRAAALFATLAFVGVTWADGFWRMALVMVGFSFFWHAALPQFEATTLNHLGADEHGYTRVRLWGSVGFIITVIGVGVLIDDFGARVLPEVLLILLASIWVASLMTPAKSSADFDIDHGPIARVIRRPEVLALLVSAFLVQASHGPYYTFFTLHLQDIGYSNRVIGVFWGLGVFAEIVLFLYMPRLIPSIGARRLLVIGLALTVLRWVLLSLMAQYLAALFLIQVLHAASFGVTHAVSIHLVHRYFTGRHQGRGQALYSSLSFGAGGALGNWVGGYAWESLGAVGTYLISAFAALLAMFVALYLSRLPDTWRAG